MTPLEPPEALADQLMAQHAAFFRDHPDGQIPPHCLIIGEDGEGAIVPTPWESPAEREIYLMALRALTAKLKAIRYAFWSEAWFTTGEAAQAFKRQREESDRWVSMETTPGRQECVFTLVVDAARKTPLFHRQAIVRDAAGLVRELTPMEPFDFDGFGGDLAGLLPRRAYQ